MARGIHREQGGPGHRSEERPALGERRRTVLTTPDNQYASALRAEQAELFRLVRSHGDRRAGPPERLSRSLELLSTR